MKLRPALQMLRLALWRTAETAALLVGLAWLASRVDGLSPGLSSIALLALLGPIAGAVGVALAVAETRASGRWTSWSSLGYSPRSQVGALVVVAGLGMGFQAQLGGGAAVVLDAAALPAPIAEAALSWPDVDPADFGDLAGWQVPPAKLSTSALIHRMRLPAPAGARSGVDWSELVRRCTWVLAWPLGTLLAVVLARRVPCSARNESSWTPWAAAVLAGLATTLFCLLAQSLAGAFTALL